jgi:hypothetical protein
MLDDLLIATPCRADWNQMTGDDRVRTCATCSKRVFNISALTRVEAETLVASNRGAEWCGRYYQRVDGTIVLADCLVRGSGAGARKLALAAALATGTACAHHAPPLVVANTATWQLHVAAPVAASPELLFGLGMRRRLDLSYSFGGALRELDFTP